MGVAYNITRFELCVYIILFLQCFDVFFQTCQVFSAIHRSELLTLMECTFLTNDIKEQGNTGT